MTTSAKWRPAELLSLSLRSSTGGSTPAIASRAASCASSGVVSMSTSMFDRISLAAAISTSTRDEERRQRIRLAVSRPPRERADQHGHRSGEVAAE